MTTGGVVELMGGWEGGGDLPLPLAALQQAAANSNTDTIGIVIQRV
jgi:hypothetical protein